MNESTTSFVCVFCKKVYSSKSTLGRHLDTKKGDPTHPEDEVERVRGIVARRGDKKDVGETEARRSKVSKKYNSKSDVKERNKLRRKLRDQKIGAMLKASEWYLNKLSHTTKEMNTFPGMVAAHLPPTQWPKYGETPGKEQLNHLLGRVEEVKIIDLGRVYSVFGEWTGLKAEEQRQSWNEEVWSALQSHLGKNSLWEVSEARQLVKKKQEEILGPNCELLDLDDAESGE